MSIEIKLHDASDYHIEMEMAKRVMDMFGIDAQRIRKEGLERAEELGHGPFAAQRFTEGYTVGRAEAYMRAWLISQISENDTYKLAFLSYAPTNELTAKQMEHLIWLTRHIDFGFSDEEIDELSRRFKVIE